MTTLSVQAMNMTNSILRGIDMNLITETRYKLNYQKNNLESLLETDTSKLTKDAKHYINDEITKAKRNIEYYEGIIKVLEERN